MKDIGYHRNLVSILGCCTLREPYCLIVEHVPYGDLLTCLRKIRHKIQEVMLQCLHRLITPGPLYNTLRYNTDITLITVGPQLVILDHFCYYVYTF